MRVRSRAGGWRYALWLAWLGGVVGLGADGGGLAPRFLVRDWQMEDGLPDSSVKAIAQSRDGYLWVGTDRGLARFDGVQFKTYTPRNTPGLRSGRIRCLWEDRRGVLWVGTEGGGLSCRVGGELRIYDADPRFVPGSDVWSLLEDPNGSIWAQVEGERLLRVQLGTAAASGEAEAGERKRYPDEVRVPGGIHGTSAAQVGGRAWIASGEGLFAFDGARLMREPAVGVVEFLARKPGGGLWIAGYNWLGAYDLGEGAIGPPEPLPWAGERSEVRITALCADRTGGLWVGGFVNGVVCREREGPWRYVVHEGPLFQNIINCIFEDRESSIWIGTEDAGLYRVRRRAVTAIPLPPEYHQATVQSAWAARDGSVWLGTDGAGALRYEAGRFTRYGESEGLSSAQVYMVVEDSRGRVWAATRDGLLRFREGRFEKEARCGAVPAPPKCLFEDRTRRLWVGGIGGAACLEEGRATWYTNRMEGQDVRAIAQDREGRIWMASVSRGLHCVEGDRLRHHGAAEGFTNTTPVALLADREGTLWIGSYQEGLVRMKDGRFTTLSTRDGLVNNVAGHLAEDPNGHLWISSVRGLMRVSLAALRDYRPGEGRPLPCLSLTVRDGLFTVLGSGGSDPAMSWDAAGRLWLPNTKAVAVVDPAALPALEPAPPFVEELLVNGQNRLAEGVGGLRLKSGRDRIEFHYTSLNLAAAEHTRFQVQLEGWDKEWIDSGFHRAAHYRALPPGRYTFRVMASQRDGSWLEAPRGLALRVVPRWWETWWFQGGAGAALVGAVAGGVQLAAWRRAREKLRRLEHARAIERERARIAQDIHDELGAGLAQIGLLADLGGDESADRGEARRHCGAIAQRARGAVTSLDEIVWAVNPSNDNLARFAEYLCRLAEELCENGPTRCVKEVPVGLPAAPMRAEARHHLTLAVKEALTNTLKHAQATQVRLRVAWSEPDLEVAVEDDGCGFDPALATDRGNGLSNQRARLHKLGGEVELDTQPGRGTKSVFRVRLSRDDS